MMYFLLGVLAPLFLNILHMCIGIYITVSKGSVMSLAFSGAGFFTKSIGMTFSLNFKYFIPLLSSFFLMTHFIEAFVIQHYIQQNVKPHIQALQK